MEESRPPEPEMTQRIIGPDGNDATGAFVRETKKEFRECLRTVFLTIARKSYLREQDIAGETIASATGCFERYFQSLKGQTNVSADMIERLVFEEVSRQDAFYRGLHDLKRECRNDGIELEILPPENNYCEPAWTSDLSFGTTLRAGHTFLVAFPPVTLRTMYYLTLTQAPVAADVITVTDRFILLHPNGQDAGDALLATLMRLYGARKDVTPDVPRSRLAASGSGYLLVDGDLERTDDDLAYLRTRYDVRAVITADSSAFTAILRLPESTVTERLLRETGTG